MLQWDLIYDSTPSGNNNGKPRGSGSLKFFANGRNTDYNNTVDYIKFYVDYYFYLFFSRIIKYLKDEYVCFY